MLAALVSISMARGAESAVFYQGGDDSLLSFEAEHATAAADAGGHQWLSYHDAGSASEDSAMRALPNNDARIEAEFAANSPRLDYDLSFATPGVYYVWIRGTALGSSSDDSLHVGLDGLPASTADRVALAQASTWAWTNATMDGPRATVTVPTTGRHTLSIWMREDGTIVDKIVLTLDPAYTPASLGPTESPTSPVPTPDDLDADGLSDAWEVTVGLDPTVADDTETDTDLDGLTLSQEAQYLTHPDLPDTDGDGMPDGYEVEAGFNPLNPDDASDDADGDGLMNVEEFVGGTDPHAPNLPLGTTYYQDELEPTVAIEAEYCIQSTSAAGVTWEPTNSPVGAAKNWAMTALPNTGLNVDAGYVAGSPHLAYGVEFLHAGTYRVWLRGHARGSTSDDSVHVGFDGAAVSSADRITFLGAGDWQWSNATMDGVPATVTVAAPGWHTIDLWMREDGVIIDRIVLSLDGGFVPTGLGPEESSIVPPPGPPDEDGDGLSDAWETAHGYDPLTFDDTTADTDFDGLDLLQEYANDTNPADPDSDGDTLDDGFEVAFGLDPNDPSDADLDSDGDGYRNTLERLFGLDPNTYDPPEFGSNPPPYLSVARVGDQVHLSWTDETDGEVGFFVERRHNGAAWAVWTTTAANAVVLIDEMVTPGNTYAYRVRPRSDAGLGLASNIATAVMVPPRDEPVTLLPRLGHVDGAYGIARYADPMVLDYEVPLGSGRLVLIGLSYEQNTNGQIPKANFTDEGQTNDDKTIASISYGGVPLRRLRYAKTVKAADGHNNHVEFLYLLEEDLAYADGDTWELSWFETIDDNDNLRGFVATYGNVDQEDPFASTAAAVSSSLSSFIGLSIGTAPQGLLHVQSVAGNSGSTTWLSGVSEIFDIDYSGVCASLATGPTLGDVVDVGVNVNSGTDRRALLAAALRPAVLDSDGDGLRDAWEISYGLDPWLADDGASDLDGDQLDLSSEYAANTDPTNADTDGDGMPDGYEVAQGFSPVDPTDAALDADMDGRSNLEEFEQGTDPHAFDIDTLGFIDLGLPPGDPFALLDLGLATTSEGITDARGRRWNNLTEATAGGSAVALKNIDGDLTGVVVKTVQSFSGASSTFGVTSGTVYSLDSVKRDYFWTGAAGSEVGVLEFSNLPVGHVYTFVMYGSRVDNGENRMTRFTVIGATSAYGDVQAINNQNTVVALDVEPDPSGRVWLQVAAAAPALRAHLNAVEIVFSAGN